MMSAPNDNAVEGNDVPESYCCPITNQVMIDPVVDPEGNTYERKAILDWLSRQKTSPITRNPLRPEQLTPNRALHDLLVVFHGGSGVGSSNVPPAQLKSDGDDNITALAAAAAVNLSIEDDIKQQQQPPPAVAPPKFDVSLKSSFDKKEGLGLVQVTVSDDESLVHIPSQVVCVIDVSYSMDSAAKMHGDSEGSAGLSLLDVVKHATATVIETLDDNDELAVVAYASSAEITLPFTKMTQDGRTVAHNAVKALKTCGQTNIWDGLSKAMDLVRENDSNNNTTILLLTDGLPNLSPPRGEVETLVQYKESHPELRCQISTFGFGYSLNSQLLNDLAVEGGGHYGFIPDSSFVGTIFINATSNILSTAIPGGGECQLLLEAVNKNVTIMECLSLRKKGVTKSKDGTMSISLPGGLRYGQTFDVLVRLKDKRNKKDKESGAPPIFSTFRYPNGLISDRENKSINPIKPSGKRRSSLKGMLGMSSRALSLDDDDGVISILAAFERSKVVDIISSNADMDERDEKVIKQVSKDVKKLLDKMKKSGITKKDSKTKALEEDLAGQITEAYSRQSWYRKWGRHYLLSLARAHELQQCSNFKDPGVQVYETKKFGIIRDKAEDLFCKLPPPTPSRVRDDTNAVVITSMGRYYNAGAPCFAEGNVKLVDGRYVSVKDIVPGDMIAFGSSCFRRIKCVVATACEDGIADLVELDGGVLVTPWHPVRTTGVSSGCWRFPCDIAPVISRKCDKVYSFVLEDDKENGIMQIGPYDAVTLGHGIEDDPIAKHDYLGTDKVIQDLSNMAGWKEGRIELDPNPAVRDSQTGLIVSFQQRGSMKNNEKCIPAAVATSIRKYNEETASRHTLVAAS